MKKQGLRNVAWFAGLALLVQGLVACSAIDSPMAPTSDDGATIQKVHVIDDGTGGGGTPEQPFEGSAPPDYDGSGGRIPTIGEPGTGETEG